MNTINIEQSKNVESDLRVITDYNDFSRILSERQVTDLSQNNVKIINNGNNYIFQINGENLFQITTKHILINYINNYYDNLKQNDIIKYDKVVEFGLDNTKKLITIEVINRDLKDLAQEILDKQEVDLDAAKDPQQNRQKIGILRAFYKEVLETVKEHTGRKFKKKYTPTELLNRGSINIKAEQNLVALEKLSKLNAEARGKLEEMKQNKTVRPSTDPTLKVMEVAEKLDELIVEHHRTDLEINKLRTGDSSEISLYNIDLNKINKKQAEQLLKLIERYNKGQQEATAISAGIVGGQMIGKDLAGLQDYLQTISKGKKATFKLEYQDQLDELNRTMGTANAYFDNADTSTRAGTNTNRRSSTTNIENQSASGVFTQEEINNMNPQERRIYNSMLEANSKGGVFGALDHRTKDYQDQSPRGQQFYKSFGNVALLAGGIFLGAKFIKSAWRIITGKAAKDENDNSWAWILGTSGLLLATAGRPQDLFKGGYSSEKLSDFFQWVGLGKAKKTAKTATTANITAPIVAPTEPTGTETLAQNTIGAVALFNGQTYGSMKKMLEQTGEGKNQKIKIKEDQYEEMMTQLNLIIENGTDPNKKERAQLQKAFLKQIGPKDETGFVNTVLTGIGLSRDEISKNDNEKVNFDDKFKEKFERILKLTEYMQDKKINNMNDGETEAVKQYISEGNPKLNTIFKERFELIKERKAEIDTRGVDIEEMSNEDIFNIEDFDKRLVVKERRKTIKENNIDETIDDAVLETMSDEEFGNRIATKKTKGGIHKGELEVEKTLEEDENKLTEEKIREKLWSEIEKLDLDFNGVGDAETASRRFFVEKTLGIIGDSLFSEEEIKGLFDYLRLQELIDSKNNINFGGPTVAEYRTKNNEIILEEIKNYLEIKKSEQLKNINIVIDPKTEQPVGLTEITDISINKSFYGLNENTKIYSIPNKDGLCFYDDKQLIFIPNMEKNNYPVEEILVKRGDSRKWEYKNKYTSYSENMQKYMIDQLQKEFKKKGLYHGDNITIKFNSNKKLYELTSWENTTEITPELIYKPRIVKGTYSIGAKLKLIDLINELKNRKARHLQQGYNGNYEITDKAIIQYKRLYGDTYGTAPYKNSRYIKSVYPELLSNSTDFFNILNQQL